MELAEYSKGNGYSKGDLTEVGTPIILYGGLNTKYRFVIDEVGTFAIPKNGSVYSQGNEVIVPASVFGSCHFKRRTTKRTCQKAQGKSVVHIHNSDIQEVTISYPLRMEQDSLDMIVFLQCLPS